MLSVNSFITLSMIIFIYFKSISFSSLPCALQRPVRSSKVSVMGVQSSFPQSNVHSESFFHQRLYFSSMMNSTILFHKPGRENISMATMDCDRPNARVATPSLTAGTPSTDKQISPLDICDPTKTPSAAISCTRTRPLTASKVISSASSAIRPNPLDLCFFTTNRDPGGDGLSDIMIITLPTKSFIIRMTLRGPRTHCPLIANISHPSLICDLAKSPLWDTSATTVAPFFSSKDSPTSSSNSFFSILR
mmetsp:Transcript_17089/g.36864  ORF Transcript_17089/g.36864 Transcript_17089/m.36864 type:complete len:248 (-) Transcript_17089:93-836(-)